MKMTSFLSQLIAGSAALVALAAQPAGAQQGGAAAATLGVELNKLEQTGAACRAYMVLTNRTATALERLSLDLVVFDTSGVIDRRLAVALGPLAAGRTQVEVFDMAGLECARVARVLMNDVLECSPGRVAEATTCAEALRVSGRGDIAFIR